MHSRSSQWQRLTHWCARNPWTCSRGTFTRETTGAPGFAGGRGGITREPLWCRTYSSNHTLCGSAKMSVERMEHIDGRFPLQLSTRLVTVAVGIDSSEPSPGKAGGSDSDLAGKLTVEVAFASEAFPGGGTVVPPRCGTLRLPSPPGSQATTHQQHPQQAGRLGDARGACS